MEEKVSPSQVVVLSGREVSRYMRYICDRLEEHDKIVLSATVDYLPLFHEIRRYCKELLKCIVGDIRFGHIKRLTDDSKIPVLKCFIRKTSSLDFSREFIDRPVKKQ